jgi:hypothetical protein
MAFSYENERRNYQDNQNTTHMFSRLGSFLSNLNLGQAAGSSRSHPPNGYRRPLMRDEMEEIDHTTMPGGFEEPVAQEHYHTTKRSIIA